VERVPTGVGVTARGRDDFHIVPDQSPLVVAGRGNEWDAVKPVLTFVADEVTRRMAACAGESASSRRRLPGAEAVERALPEFMKRLVVNLSLSLLGLLLAPAPAHAVPKLIAGVVRGFPGRTVEVPISLRYRTNDVRDVVALQADVVFDATGVDDGAAAPGTVAANHVVDSSNPVNGTRRLLLYSLAGSVLTNGEIARIPFAVGENEFRNFTLRLENVIFVRADASQVPSETIHGAIAVNQVYVGPTGQADGFLDVATNGTEQCFIIQATSDFQSWVNVQTNSTEEALLQFIDPAAGAYPHRFYRAILCTSPSGLPAATVATITQLPGGRVQFDFRGANGRSYVIQASTNLTDWQNVRTNVGLNGPITFTDSFTNLARRFYRVRAVE